MIGSGAGLNRGMLLRIAAAWVFTLPVTILVAAGLFYLLGGRGRGRQSVAAAESQKRSSGEVGAPPRR